MIHEGGAGPARARRPISDFPPERADARFLRHSSSPIDVDFDRHIDCGRDGDFARRVLQGLIARDIFVRMPGVAPLDRCIRVSAGQPADLAAFAAALPEALEQARA
jgi:hypothetical protein